MFHIYFIHHSDYTFLSDLRISAIDRDAGKNAEVIFDVTDDNFKVKGNKIADSQYEAILVVAK